MHNKKKYFIWGDYLYANFGDTLQVALIADYLTAKGHNIRIYKSKEPIRDYKIENCVHTGIKWCDTCLLGGGAVFSELSLNNTYHALYNKEIGDLVFAIEKFKKRTTAISVGCGQIHRLALSHNQISLLESPYFRGGTVRLKVDRFLLSSYKSFSFYPDIVFLVDNSNLIYPSTFIENHSFLINLPIYFIPNFILRFLLKFPKFINISLFSVFSSFLDEKKYKPKDRNSSYTRTFKTAFSLLTWLKKGCSGVLITHKLHLFVAFLALGGLPFSFLSYKKTRLFLKENNLSFLTGFLGAIFLAGCVCSQKFKLFIKQILFFHVKYNIIQARNHLLVIDE